MPEHAAPQRHRDDGSPLAAYADQVAVVCPRCGAPAWIAAAWQPYAWRALLRCRCGLRLDDASPWQGPTELSGYRACGGCGHKWVSVRRSSALPPAHPPATLDASCARCGWRGPVPVDAGRLRDGSAVDPHFGLPLLLQAPTRAGLVWAYNGRHLQTLAGFASAPLRERRGAGNRSLFSRLPVWMKLARHRPLLLRAVQRLQVQLAALPACPALPPADPAA